MMYPFTAPDSPDRDPSIVATIDWATVDPVRPQPLNWITNVTGCSSVFALIGLVMGTAMIDNSFCGIPFIALSLIFIFILFRIELGGTNSVVHAAIFYIVIGGLLLIPPSLFMVFEFRGGFDLKALAILNVVALPGLACLGIGFWLLTKRHDYAIWMNLRDRHRFIAEEAQKIIIAGAKERNIDLPDGEFGAFAVDNGSAIADQNLPLNWIALARTSAISVRTAWLLPAIVGTHDEYSPQRLRRTMILYFVNNTDPIFLDGETLHVVRYHINERRFETIAESLAAWLFGVRLLR